MTNLENINWELERDLVCVPELREDNYTEEGWDISFEYNGHKLTSVISFTLDLKITEDEHSNSPDVDVVSTDVTINEVLDSEGESFELPAKEEIKLQNLLATDLKIQF